MNFRYSGLFIFVLALLSSACSTPGDLRLKPPAFDGSSSKDAKLVAGCIADRWESAGRTNFSVRPTSDGYSLTAADAMGIYGKDTAAVIDVRDTKTGSTTLFYSNMMLSAGTNLVANIVRECLK